MGWCDMHVMVMTEKEKDVSGVTDGTCRVHAQTDATMFSSLSVFVVLITPVCCFYDPREQ